MEERTSGIKRRTFLKTAVASTVAAGVVPGLVDARQFKTGSLQVWSCGGLSEAFASANRVYENRTGVKISYTGAFAAALGKSLLGGGRDGDICRTGLETRKESQGGRQDDLFQAALFY